MAAALASAILDLGLSPATSATRTTAAAGAAEEMLSLTGVEMA